MDSLAALASSAILASMGADLFDFPLAGDACMVFGVPTVCRRAERSTVKRDHVWVYIEKDAWDMATTIDGPLRDYVAMPSVMNPGQLLVLVPSGIIRSA